ncbi:unnamed protein product [Rhizophagus irregularis]|nr:unnamed protein product [Rhizophagus irregularis]
MAEIGQDLSRELAIGLALIYPISITYTTPTKESKNELTNNTLKRKEIVSGTSDMQWTVSTLRRAAIYLCNYYDKFGSIFFIYKAIKPKTKHSNTSIGQFIID